MAQRDACKNPAPGGPGIPARWTRGDKDAIGTAYSTSSPLWFTTSRGLLNEVYFPTADRPQMRDLQYLVTDGESFFHDERRDLESTVEPLSDYCLGVKITNSSPDGRYRIIKEIITNPHEACLLVHTRMEGDPDFLATLRVFVLCAPHLEVGGAGNHGKVLAEDSEQLLVAHKGNTWMAMKATLPFLRCSCGFVGVNDGWTDLHENFQMDWEYDCALDGNIALTGELDLSQGHEWVLGLAFGQGLHHVATVLFQTLAIPFEEHRARFLRQWEEARDDFDPATLVTFDEGKLYLRSHSLLLAHEDKRYPGAMVASLSIPWGQVKGDEEGNGGYHLVWTRDMVNSVMGLLATGNTATPLRALIYLAIAQRPDGGFYQNFWVNGKPFWTGVQLDEVAFPILLAWQLRQMDALKHFDPYPMMRRAAAYLIRQGPATPQDRWEEASGYAPYTLATNIAALCCTAIVARERGDEETAAFIEAYADFLESHIEQWTVTTEGTLHPAISRYYIRLTPADTDDPTPHENPNTGILTVANRPPEGPHEFPAKDVVDAGFLQLVRYGIRAPDDPLIVDSLKVVDAVLKKETPFGPAWYRYNHDGYGQRPDGGPFAGWGKGRPWPLLAAERGHYELAAGRSPEPYIRALEQFAHPRGLLAEQVWDEEDLPEEHLFCGRPTGAATPLMWAHAEYIKLVRSATDGHLFDHIPEVAARYQHGTPRPLREVWKPNRRVPTIKAGCTLRVQLSAPFRLRWTTNEWQDQQEARSVATSLGLEFVDIPIADTQRAPLRLAFEWLGEPQVEEREFVVEVMSDEG